MSLSIHIAGTAQAATRLKHSTVQRDYRVRGRTSRQLVSSMRARPFPGDNGPALANIRPRYRLKIQTWKVGKACRVEHLDLNIRFVMTLPKATHAGRFDRRTRVAWNGFTRFTHRHELVHRRIYIGCARRFLSQSKRMTSSRSCAALQQDIRRKLRQADKGCDRQHDAFDRQDFPRVPGLALFRQAGSRSYRRTGATGQSRRRMRRGAQSWPTLAEP